MQPSMVTSSRSLFGGALAACTLASCVLFEPETRPCRPSEEFCQARDSGVGGVGGEGGEGGAGSSGSGGSDSGSGGDGGDSGQAGQGGGGSGGDSGAGGEPAPCDDACSATELCDEDRDICVGCLDDDDCSDGVCIDDQCEQCRDDDDCDGSTPACDIEDNTCVGCTDNDHCTGEALLCDTELQQCFECLSDSDCNDASASRCDAGACTACTESTQCGHLEDTTVCDVSGAEGVCVQCTGASFDACGAAPGGTPYVCNATTKICTTEEQGSALACEPCIADAHCRTGTACMQTKFGSTATGNFCLWREDADGASAPNGNCGNVRPYIGTEDEWTSIEGVAATVCKPAVTTCQAQNDFRAKTCMGPTATGHAQCGAEGVNDAFCAPFLAGHRCTVPCVSFDDCDDTRPGPNSDTECEMQTLGATDIQVCQFE